MNNENMNGNNNLPSKPPICSDTIFSTVKYKLSKANDHLVGKMFVLLSFKIENPNINATTAIEYILKLVNVIVSKLIKPELKPK
jgi:hypothetical protein